MTEILADLDDINTHLPEDKLQASDEKTDKLQIDAARMIRAMLAGFVPTATLVAWVEPADTPEIIRGIAGKLIASKYYSIRYAEDSDASVYAQSLYIEAISDINKIREGTLLILDDDGEEITITGVNLEVDDFWPNDSSEPPKFTMGQVFS